MSTVGGMPGDVEVEPGTVVPEHELRWRFSRSSGPGGQSVNTTDSRVQLSLDVSRTTALTPVQRERALDRLAYRLVDGVVTVTASQYRSQLRNREEAERRLAQLLRKAIASPPPPRRPTRPTRSSQRRRLEAKRRRSETKQQRRRPEA